MFNKDGIDKAELYLNYRLKAEGSRLKAKMLMN
jgi:hypothetical protein